MTQYAWPGAAGGFATNHFELRISPNTRTHVGPYTRTRQVIDLLGERWRGVVQLAPTNSLIYGAAREAFFDRLKGEVHTIGLYHVKRPYPLGSARGTTTTTAAAAQLANTVPIGGSGTLKAGDQFTIGGQFVRAMADCTLPATVEFQPRLRVAMGSGTAVNFDKPLVNVSLASDGVPVSYVPGLVEGGQFEFIEVW